jgi:PhnB protein
MIIEASPLLIFRGNCEEAFEHYRSIFGGDYQFLYRYRDIPLSKTPKEHDEKILHVSLPLMKNVNLMGMDTLEETIDSAASGVAANATGQAADAPTADAAGPVSIGLRLNEETETRRLFDALSEGGRIVEPLTKTFYAGLFGVLVDRHGVAWSFNCNIGRKSLI